jgi:hypothetical protein
MLLPTVIAHDCASARYIKFPALKLWGAGLCFPGDLKKKELWSFDSIINLFININNPNDVVLWRFNLLRNNSYSISCGVHLFRKAQARVVFQKHY